MNAEQLALIAAEAGKREGRAEIIALLEKELVRLKEHEYDEYYYLDAGIQHVLEILKKENP